MLDLIKVLVLWYLISLPVSLLVGFVLRKFGTDEPAQDVPKTAPPHINLYPD